MSTPAVEIKNLSFTYPGRDTQILHGVDLSVPRGSIVALMGGSGSGKTTLVRLMTGQYPIPAGASVNVDGEDVEKLNLAGLYRLRLRLGMLFQNPALFTDLSVGENVAFPLREHSRLPEAAIHDLVLLKLHAVGLRSAAARYPSELSGGQQRRVALARAIALDPHILLYDEPFAGLDPVSQTIIAKLIKELNDHLGSTSIIITHDVEQTFAIADHVCLMWHGRVIASGTPAEMNAADDPIVNQFIHGRADGPLPFHLPGSDYRGDLRLGRD